MARPSASTRGAAKTAPAKRAKAVKKTTPAKKVTKVAKKPTPVKSTTKSKKVVKPVRKSTKSVKKGIKAIKKTQPVPAPLPDADNEEPQCSVCMDDLSSKRALQFLPCAHSFHRTCAIEWLETRDRKADQICPLCRQKVENIKENKKTLENCHLAQGGKQPCASYMYLMKREQGAQGSTEDFVEWLKTKCRKEIAAIRAQRKNAVKKGLCADYVDDMDKELIKLTERVKIFNEMDVDSDDDDDFFVSPNRMSGPIWMPGLVFPLMRGPFRPMGMMSFYRSVAPISVSPESSDSDDTDSFVDVVDLLEDIPVFDERTQQQNAQANN